MGTFVEVDIIQSGKEGKALLKFPSGDEWFFSVDSIRRLYYAILGIEMIGETLEEYLEIPVSSPLGLSVDVPEDILKIEAELQKKGENERRGFL